MRLSATIITRNEEKNIADCLASLDFADEIIVVDSGSTDRTEEICRLHPKVRFFHQEWLGYGTQKNRAAELASCDWILNLDADERVTPTLRDSIIHADTSTFSAARMARENYFGKRWIRHCGWYPDFTTRLYDRRTCSFSDRAVHETLECEGKVVTLEGNLVHRTYENISDYLRRMDKYSTLAAEEMCRAGKSIGVVSLLLKPIATFIKMYVIRKGFLEGSSGLLLSVLYTQYTFCKYAKLRELKAANS
ncbi:glycosyltransferase family 2 protein [Pelotalea chapellei]|uniref:Glycosyltransferase family 2 protein n=1 Tax=Pelotalea chapellei TaxID=44671 RepID=A0ABS5U6R9_9BACT|nr:glycosyltransferase family 2 protein [Pelotalea chapellei]MBT1071364.1 glycosyltransferase family 2 protein [Pelotalea chapellei]